MFYFDCKNDFVGFTQNTEWLPKIFDKFTSEKSLRKLFLSLTNNVLQDFCNFDKRERELLCKVTLKQAFEYKIKSMLPISFVRPYKVIKSFTLDSK